MAKLNFPPVIPFGVDGDMLHKYGKGTMMTFPLEFTEVTEEQKEWDDQYLMPMEAKKIQLEVMEMCDQMEYDGSPMFDCYPDRIIIGRMVQKICGERCNDPYYNALVQVMLCKEMRCRRNRRDCHKKRILH